MLWRGRATLGAGERMVAAQASFEARQARLDHGPGATYSSSVATSGGTGLYTYSVTSGAIPAGLAFNSPAAGGLSGTPAVGTFNLQVTATDTATSCTGVQNYTVHIGSNIAAGDCSTSVGG